jgi:hypothetical protein
MLTSNISLCKSIPFFELNSKWVRKQSTTCTCLLTLTCTATGCLKKYLAVVKGTPNTHQRHTLLLPSSCPPRWCSRNYFVPSVPILEVPSFSAKNHQASPAATLESHKYEKIGSLNLLSPLLWVSVRAQQNQPEIWRFPHRLQMPKGH